MVSMMRVVQLIQSCLVSVGGLCEGEGFDIEGGGTHSTAESLRVLCSCLWVARPDSNMFDVLMSRLGLRLFIAPMSMAAQSCKAEVDISELGGVCMADASWANAGGRLLGGRCDGAAVKLALSRREVLSRRWMCQWQA